MLVPCPACFMMAAVGGYAGSFFGIDPPESFEGKIISSIVTSNLVIITVVALKALFNISLCGSGGYTWKNIAIMGIKAWSLGAIYSIGVNYLLSRYAFPQPPNRREDSLQENQTPCQISSCCQSPSPSNSEYMQ